MLQLWTSSVLLFAVTCALPAGAISIPYKAPDAAAIAGEGLTTTADGKSVFVLRAAAPPSGSALDRTGWTVTVDSFQAGIDNEGENVLDGDPNSIWHSQWNPNLPLPHEITVDMKTLQNVNGISYLPRQDGISNGNIGQHKIFLSTDGSNFGSPVAIGSYLDDSSLKYTVFETQPARYLKIQALSEAGNRGTWTSIAELNVFAAPSYTPPAAGLGKWGPTIDFPIVPVAAAVEYGTGNVLTWSSFAPDTFSGASGGKTVTSTYNPSTGVVSQRTVTETSHDMFCPGLSIDGNGTVVVTGGNNAEKTSLYNQAADAWNPGPNMNIARGYQSTATTSSGKTFVIGGSWSGGYGGKNGEIYDPTTNTWSLLNGCPVAPMLTADNHNPSIFRADNHAWLFGWKSGAVFQAGPSKAMNWYGTTGTGTVTAAGLRASDGDSMCGNAVMYDAVNGKILTIGGSPNYEGSPATGAAHIITIGTPGQQAQVTTLTSAAYQRIFANAVVLPDGSVFVAGGQTIGQPFADNNPSLTPELFSPATNTFTKMAPNSVPRTYHSIGLLLMDGTVLIGGGGLCGGCSTNHFDAQVYTPPYLLNSSGGLKTRPVINSVSAAAIRIGGTLTVATNSAVTSMSLVRFGSSTHTVNTDQRRIPLTLTRVGTNRYTVRVPNDAGIALPGYWMLFAINSAGTPSLAKTVKINP